MELSYLIDSLCVAPWVRGRRQAMRRENGYSLRLQALLAVGVSLAALTVSVGSSGETSEIDAFKAAIKSQSEAEAIHFIKNFGSGDLADDLIRSLRSNVAQQVCIDLRGGGSAEVREACQAFPAAAVLVPPSVEPQGTSPDLSATAPDLFTGEVDQITTVAPSAGPSPSGPPVNEPQGGHDNGGNLILPPTTQTPSTSAQETSSQTSGAASSGSTSTSDSTGTSASNGDSSASSGGSAAGSDSSGSDDSSGSGVSAGASGDVSGEGVSAGGGVGVGGVSAGGGLSAGGGGVSAGGGLSAGD
jgi:hypothetical protein